MENLGLEQCNDLLRLAREKAEKDYARPICAAICDGAGFLIAFSRMKGAPVRSIAISQGKAYSAARMGITTQALLERMHRENIAPGYFCDEKLTALPGGSVLRLSNGGIVGGIGISGLTSAEDQVIADYISTIVEARS